MGLVIVSAIAVGCSAPGSVNAQRERESCSDPKSQDWVPAVWAKIEPVMREEARKRALTPEARRLLRDRALDKDDVSAMWQLRDAYLWIGDRRRERVWLKCLARAKDKKAIEILEQERYAMTDDEVALLFTDGDAELGSGATNK